LQTGSEAVGEYLASVKKYPNPPAPNITRFGGGSSLDMSALGHKRPI
jgi:hypothetical protein